MKERKNKYRSASDALTTAAPAPRRRKRKSARGLVLVVALAALASAVVRPACVERLGDVPLRLASAIEGHEAPPEIAIVAIDDRSMEELGSWPWPRSTFVGILEKLRQMDAGLIVVDSNVASDVGISEMRLPVRNDGGPDYVVGYDFYPTLSTIPPDTKAEAMDRELREAAEKLAFPSTPSDDSPIPAMAGIRINRFPASDRLYLREGFGNLFPDPDGRLRSQQLAARLRHRAYPSLALAAAAKWRGFTPILAQDAEGRPSGVVLGEKRIETKSDARLAINFRGRAGTFDAISAADVASGKAPRESVEGRLLLLGLYSPMLKASHPTPFGNMTDVEILANSVDNLLFDRSLVSYAGMAGRTAAFAAVALIYALLLVRLSPRWQLAATILIVAALSFCATASIALKRVVIPAAFPAAGAILLYFTMTLWRLVRHEAPRLVLRGALKGRARNADIEAIASDASILSGPA
ncbi:MAG TPA: CHASE2 domain-containing protein, partial [bacterium]|nr:CHASE2 domain-containing protein [bacterium]